MSATCATDMSYEFDVNAASDFSTAIAEGFRRVTRVETKPEYWARFFGHQCDNVSVELHALAVPLGAEYSTDQGIALTVKGLRVRMATGSAPRFWIDVVDGREGLPSAVDFVSAFVRIAPAAVAAILERLSARLAA